MYFALGFITFYMLDILVFYQFYILGMVPMHFLISAVTLFMGLLMWRSLFLFSVEREKKFLIVWVVYSLVVAFVHFLWATHLLWSTLFYLEQKRVFRLHMWENVVLLCLSVIIFIAIRLYLSVKNPLRKWMLFSSAATLFRYGMSLFFNPLPFWAYRYSGILFFPVLFGWLMVVHKLIYLRFVIERRPAGIPFPD